MKTQSKLKLKPAYKKVIGNIIYPIVSLLIFFAIWAIASTAYKKPLVFPMPDEVFTEFFKLFALNIFWAAVGDTLGRTLLCFVISFAAAFILAAVGGIFKSVHRLISPIVSILRAIPTMSIILIIMLWVDFQNAPMYIGFLIAFPMLYSDFYTAISGVDKDLIEMTNIYKIRPLDKVRFLYVPSVAPAMFSSSGASLSLTLKIVIAAEVLCYTVDSIGHEMQYAKLTFEIPYLLAWTVLAVILSMLLELAVAGLKKLWEVRR